MADDVHAEAFLALLGAAPQTTFDGAVPDGAEPPYRVVYIRTRYQDDGRLPVHSRRAVSRATVHSVGETASAARKVAEATRAALLDAIPVLDGRVCWPIRHENSLDPQRDESTGALVMDQVDVYVLQTEPG